MVLECFASIDEDHRHLIVVLLPQLGVAIDVKLVPFKVSVTMELRKRLFNYITEMTSLARIHHHFVHKEIVSGCRGQSPGSMKMAWYAWISRLASRLPGTSPSDKWSDREWLLFIVQM